MLHLLLLPVRRRRRLLLSY